MSLFILFVNLGVLFEGALSLNDFMVPNEASKKAAFCKYSGGKCYVLN